MMVEEKKKSNYVLIVDDNDEARRLLSRIMIRFNVPYETVTNGLDALSKIAEMQPSLILLDLMMPGLDGFGVLNALRSNMETRRVPVVVVTALSPEEANLLRLPGILDVTYKGDYSRLKGLVTDLIDKGVLTPTAK